MSFRLLIRGQSSSRLADGLHPIPVLFLLIAILVSQLVGQSGTAENGEQKYTLAGTVVNSLTGEPVPRALVQIFSAGMKASLTNSEGHFEFSGLPAAQQVSLGVQKPGFFSEDQIQNRNGFSPPMLVTVGPDAPAVLLKLVPEGVIAGKITSNGEPVESVPVKVLTTEIQDGRKSWTQQGSEMSDEEGEFRIANLRPGEYYLEVGPKSIDPVAANGKGRVSGYRKVFYPSAPGIESAAPVALGLGQRMEVEIPLNLEPWYRVRGSVKETNPPVNWGLQLINSDGTPEPATFRMNRQTGEFEATAPAGAYQLEAQGYGPAGLAGSANVPVTLNADVSGLRVSLGPATAIPIVVKTESSGTRSGESSGRGTVRFARPVRGMELVSMYLRRSGFNEGGAIPVVGPDESGKPETMALRNVEPGTYWVEINKNSPWYVESAQCGNVDLLREALTVTSGVPCTEIDIVLRDDGATLGVNATWDGDPAQAMMVLLPERAPQQARMFPVGKGTGIEFGELAPGPYSVVLLQRADGLEFRDPETMSAYLSKAAHVTLTANQKTSVSAELIRVGR